jgi:hypothetical protein
MKKQLISIPTILFILILSICGCIESENNIEEPNDNRFIGTWTNTSQLQGENFELNYTFFNNESYKVSRIYKQEEISYWGIWKTKDDNIIIEIEGKTQIGTYKFSDNEKKLTITSEDGQPIVLSK